MGDNLEKDVAQIKETVNILDKKFSEVYTALCGSRITKDGGLVADVSELRDKMNKIEKGNIAKSAYVRILWSIAGGIAMYIIMHVLK